MPASSSPFPSIRTALRVLLPSAREAKEPWRRLCQWNHEQRVLETRWDIMHGRENSRREELLFAALMFGAPLLGVASAVGAGLVSSSFPGVATLGQWVLSGGGLGLAVGVVAPRLADQAMRNEWGLRPPGSPEVEGLSEAYLQERKRRGWRSLERSPNGLSEAERAQQLVDSIVRNDVDGFQRWLPHANAKVQDSLALRVAVARARPEMVHLLVPVSEVRARDHEAMAMALTRRPRLDCPRTHSIVAALLPDSNMTQVAQRFVNEREHKALELAMGEYHRHLMKDSHIKAVEDVLDPPVRKTYVLPESATPSPTPPAHLPEPSVRPLEALRRRWRR